MRRASSPTCAMKPLVGMPAPVVADDLGRQDHLSRPQMRRQPSGDAEADQKFRALGGEFDELRRTPRVPGADNHLKAGGSGDFGLRGEPGGAEHRCQCAHCAAPLRCENGCRRVDEGSAGGSTAAAKCRGWVDAFTNEAATCRLRRAQSLRERTPEDQGKNAAPRLPGRNFPRHVAIRQPLLRRRIDPDHISAPLFDAAQRFRIGAIATSATRHLHCGGPEAIAPPSHPLCSPDRLSRISADFRPCSASSAIPVPNPATRAARCWRWAISTGCIAATRR